jgi:hypothetical protein
VSSIPQRRGRSHSCDPWLTMASTIDFIGNRLYSAHADL